MKFINITERLPFKRRCYFYFSRIWYGIKNRELHKSQFLPILGSSTISTHRKIDDSNPLYEIAFETEQQAIQSWRENYRMFNRRTIIHKIIQPFYDL